MPLKQKFQNHEKDTEVIRIIYSISVIWSSFTLSLLLLFVFIIIFKGVFQDTQRHLADK